MNPRGLSVLALVGLLGAAALALAFEPRPAPAAIKPVVARAATPASIASALATSAEAQAGALPTRFSSLPALRIENQTSRELRELRLYDAQGRVDEASAQKLDELLCDARDPRQPRVGRIDRRTLQLLYKAAYHFGVKEVEVVSAYRKPGRRREGPHGTGAAIDFRLRGVSAAALASYLRELPRTGVGVYTHPKTQYVHLDSREHSFHWLDASPPRRHWREKSIGSRDILQRDARYVPSDDLP